MSNATISPSLRELLTPTARGRDARPSVQGKFLYAGGETFYPRGVTYGAFRPRAGGEQFPRPAQVRGDFERMAANGINAVRTYTVPPEWLLDLAERCGLRMMIGLPIELHAGHVADKRSAPEIMGMAREWVSGCAGHPAVLCYTIGNEFPAGLVRWHGRRRVERYLKRMYDAVKAADPLGLVTYVNYPSTEYLDLPFLDFVCFNVYLESRAALDAYLARLQNIAGDRPLVMAEIGLDSRRNGEDVQATALDWQIRTVFAAGAAGIFVYAWTDEWFAGGDDVLDWDFGLVDRQREPKPALASVRHAFAESPFSPDMAWPRISVVVCSHNGSRTIADTLDGLSRIVYPNHEVIVIDDGSTDATAAIATEFDVRLLRTANVGLSAARNTGMAAATGEIVAYIDDDARPDPHWLTYLAHTFMTTDCAAAGGPNIPPPDDGPIAGCVANAPGGPNHVLLTDREAEHIPGCNMAVRRACLEAVGGFDPRFRTAGDDVDLCWRLEERGWTVGYSPAAVVWHHRRNSVRAFWRQQVGYGGAEALLEAKWPRKYNAVGHLSWRGRLYGRGLAAALSGRRGRIYQGVWGSAPFQSLYRPPPGVLASLTAMPEWWLAVAALAVLALLGLHWAPLLAVLPLLAIAVGLPVTQASIAAASSSFTWGPAVPRTAHRLRLLTAMLYLLQPLARLYGRLRHGLSPWRWRGSRGVALPRTRTAKVWSERWRSPDDRLHALRSLLLADQIVVRRGGDFDRWDLEVRGGLFAVARVLMVVEDDDTGQLVHFRSWPRWSLGGVVLFGLVAFLTAVAVLGDAWLVAFVIGLGALVVAGRMLWEGAAAIATVRRAFARSQGGSSA